MGKSLALLILAFAIIETIAVLRWVNEENTFRP